MTDTRSIEHVRVAQGSPLLEKPVGVEEYDSASLAAHVTVRIQQVPITYNTIIRVWKWNNLFYS